jgi:hypothetical protein
MVHGEKRRSLLRINSKNIFPVSMKSSVYAELFIDGINSLLFSE